mmetsp:Transcript_19003/g.40920  ORF Transcript_19003/g.40920 Transcript_19003/m.40920 type:complete len:207 (+) Transcript_19003:439-1059(+)
MLTQRRAHCWRAEAQGLLQAGAHVLCHAGQGQQPGQPPNLQQAQQQQDAGQPGQAQRQQQGQHDIRRFFPKAAAVKPSPAAAMQPPTAVPEPAPAAGAGADKPFWKGVPLPLPAVHSRPRGALHHAVAPSIVMCTCTVWQRSGICREESRCRCTMSRESSLWITPTTLLLMCGMQTTSAPFMVSSHACLAAHIRLQSLARLVHQPG